MRRRGERLPALGPDSSAAGRAGQSSLVGRILQRMIESLVYD